MKTELWKAGRLGLALAIALLAAERSGAESGVPDLPRHQLVFARHSDAARTDYDVWWMCGDGTQLASLVTETGHQIQISVSPDGEELLYAGKLDGQREIWRRPFGRGEAVNLTDHPAEDTGPAWSPDGRRVAFFSTRDAEKPDLYLLDLGDGSLERLTDNALHDSGAEWSPDGGAILFTRYFPGEGDEPGRGEIFRLELATGEERQLTSLEGYSFDVDHSPDGEWVAFHRAHGGGSEIWLMRADGSEAHPITDTFIDEYTPAWSPDGNWIAFTAGVESDGRGTFDIWLMRPDGSHRQVLNKAANTEAWLRWRPGDHYCR